jgi:succinate dehydrogenase / fumarate reductase membrane anchor subunit
MTLVHDPRTNRAHLMQVEAPRSSRRGTPTRTNFELYGWLFMRLSGLLLVVLVLGHLLVNLVLGEGVKQIDFSFVAGKWSSPVWQTWDLAMLWLAELHGVNGLRTVINDYAEKDSTRFWLKALLLGSAILVLILGTLVIFTFDPCVDPSSTLDVCRR